MTIGFIKLHRKITDWEWYSDVNTCRLFLHLLLTAKFKDEKWRGIDIKRGQVLTGRISLAKSTSLTESQIRTAISKLKSTNEISIKITSEFSIITLTNYDLYQSRAELNDQQDTQPVAEEISSGSPANHQLVATDKEIQEEQELKRREEENKLLIESQFEDFWLIYNYKKSKPKAKLAYHKATKADVHNNIMLGLGNYLKTRGVDKQYWKHPTTWLNQECWKDEYLDDSGNPLTPQDSFCQSLNQILGQNLIKNLIDGESLVIKLHSASSNDKWDRTSQELKDKVFAQLKAKFGKPIKISF